MIWVSRPAARVSGHFWSSHALPPSKSRHNATSLYSCGLPAIFEDATDLLCCVMQISRRAFIHAGCGVVALLKPEEGGGNGKKHLHTMLICSPSGCCRLTRGSSRE